MNATSGAEVGDDGSASVFFACGITVSTTHLDGLALAEGILDGGVVRR